MPDFPETLLRPEEIDALLDWFSRCGIDYPWGENPTPYRVWISEIMLQQTVVSAAVGHFTRWMEEFPDVAVLAEAEEQAVLKAWEGLGYYSRARNILKGARYITEKLDGELPSEYEGLLKVPGIGDYTARAILSIAYGQPAPVLDANVRRIAQRLTARVDWAAPEDKKLISRLEKLIPAAAPGAFNCAVMQLGQQVCKVRNPLCGDCPLSGSCQARTRGLQGEIPARASKSLKEKHSALILLKAGGRCLLVRRKKGVGKGLWHIPSCPAGEESRFRDALEPAEVLELKERTHHYTVWKEKLSPRLYLLDREPDIIPFEGEGDYLWVDERKLDDYPTPSVYRKILKDLPSLFS